MKNIIKEFEINTFFSAFNYYWPDEYIFTGETHDFWEIVYVVSGSVQSIENAQIYTLHEGDMILHAPMEFHSIRSYAGTPTSVFVISFSMSGKIPENLSKGVFSLFPEERWEYKSIFELINSYYHNTEDENYSGLQCSSMLTAFLIKLNQNHSVKSPLLHSHSAKEYNNIIKVMTSRIYQNCTLPELAKEAGISVSYMKVLFKHYSGISPKSYFSQMRCNEASKLMQNGLTALEVSNLMNFSSPNYFSVFFKKMTGFPPAKFTRQTQKEQNLSVYNNEKFEI